MHIYRLVSESTIEENILHKSDQKRQLDHLAIQSGGFNTDFLQKFNPRELLGIQGEPGILYDPAAFKQECESAATGHAAGRSVSASGRTGHASTGATSRTCSGKVVMKGSKGAVERGKV